MLSGSGPTRRVHAAAALGYVVAALWVMRVVLAAPASLLPVTAFADPRYAQIARWDLGMVLSTVTRNAAALLHAPSSLLGVGPCFPLEAPFRLGEHMLGTGLLAAPTYLLTHDPIASYNGALLLSLWLAGFGMYLFAFEFVRRPGAAFVAGLIYALTPQRLADPMHPFAHGDHWAPFAALFLHRLLARGGAGNALAVALFASLAMLESFYALVASGVVLTVYAVHLAWTYRDRLLARLPALLLIAGFLGLVGWLVFSPYVAARAELRLQRGLGPVEALLPGRLLISVALLLALLGLADRLRGRRACEGDEPRLALLLAGLFALWFGWPAVSVFGFVIPGARWLLSGVVPGFDSVRATYLMGGGLWFAIAALAAFAIEALREPFGRPLRWAIPLAAVVLLLAERTVPQWSERAFGKKLALNAWDARPDDDDLRLLRSTHGPIVHVPLVARGPKALRSADYLRLVSFDSRPTAACYNSFRSPLVADVADLAAALPDPAAADALHALGFRTVLVHVPNLMQLDLERFLHRLDQLPGAREHVVPLGRTPTLMAFALVSHSGTNEDLRLLEVTKRRTPPFPTQTVVAGAATTLRFPLVNHGQRTFRHPRPVAASDLLVRWVRGGVTVESAQRRHLLPLAVAGNARRAIALDLTAPPEAGAYRATIAAADAPDRVLASIEVAVTPRRPALALSDR